MLLEQLDQDILLLHLHKKQKYQFFGFIGMSILKIKYIHASQAKTSKEDLVSEINQYEHLLTSTNQQEIDDATKVLLNSLKEINEKMSLNDNNIIIQQGDKYCNLILHNVWPILFFVSIGANVLIGYMLVRNTKRRFNDDIPVVDYDINDDNV